jgi:Ca-activated chloride channel family protein
LRVPSATLFDYGATGPHSRSRPLAWVLAWAAWILLVGAAARPQWLGEPIEIPVSGRDLLLAVDLSGSMETEDFAVAGQTVDRLTATRWVARDFIRRRVGDRIGLILFGERAYVQTPLTFDRETVTVLLDESAIGLAGRKTAIGDAIGLAVKRLKDRPAENRVLVLLTDGANTAGVLDPLRAADLAARHGVRIYTIGVGAEQVLVNSPFGTRRLNPSQDLDEASLKQIAERTGGRYFRARDTAELVQIYALLDDLEPVEQDQRVFRPRRELYPWPGGAALAVAGALFAFGGLAGVRA